MSAPSPAERDRLALVRPDLLREACYIGGGWRAGSRWMEVANPATGQMLGAAPSFGARETTEAIDAAAAAFPRWRAETAKARSRILRRWFELIVAHETDLARILTAEQGKPLAEAKDEIAYAAAFVEWFAEEAKRIYGETIPGHMADKRLMVIRQPVGVVGAITPWNFPAAMVTRKVAPALAAGCTVVLKPSELTPFTALALAALGEEAGLPAGVLNVVVGDAPAIGAVLTGDPRVRKLTFTGSTAIGKMLAARCMDTVKRVSLELGGNAPFIVFDDADLEAAAQGALVSKFRNTGQTCVCANRLLVQDGIYDAFAVRLAEAVGDLTPGDGLAGETGQGPLINDAALAKVQRHVDDALVGGARALAGGGRLPGPGAFFAPTVLVDVTPEMLLNREETFGPVAGLIRIKDEAEAIAIANQTAAGLAAYVFTRDLSRAARVAEALEVGMVGVNTGFISTEVSPFGGVKESGLGREGSRLGVDEYLEVKTICIQIAPQS